MFLVHPIKLTKKIDRRDPTNALLVIFDRFFIIFHMPHRDV